MIAVPADRLSDQLASILAAWDMPPDALGIMVRVMVDTDLRGIDSHGAGMLASYYQRFQNGLLIPAAKVTIITDLASMALVDGGHGPGHPAGVFAMNLAIDKARNTGVGAVTVRHSNHYGAAGYYALMAAEKGLIGISMTGTPNGAVVPTFGTKPMLGTNPIAFAAPARRNPPFLLDMATSTVALGKLTIAQRLGLPIPAGWALDENGRPTTDAAIAREARRLSPLGGNREMGSHKGYGLSAMVDILCSTLSGAAIPSVEEHFGRKSDTSNIGHFFLALDPRALRPGGEFELEMDELIDTLHATPPLDQDQSVLVAGDPENEAFAKRQKDGIPISDRLAMEIRNTAEGSGVAY
ncbi:MAG: Ldh family oxidoreductase, partial [Rhodospirillales bacterium]|nr:Ldh family oxidoreductase [Rhodospirillales bacterium]